MNRPVVPLTGWDLSAASLIDIYESRSHVGIRVWYYLLIAYCAWNILGGKRSICQGS